mgnify:CR=1 FL=1
MLEFPLFPNTVQCTENGLDSIYELGEPMYAHVAILIGCALAFEQALTAVHLAIQLKPSFQLSFRPYRMAPTLLLLWSFFTAMSVLLVSATWRNDAALLTKIFHVATEATILAQILKGYGFYDLITLAALLLYLTLVYGLVMPCTESLGLATAAGFAFDTTNLLLHVLLYVATRSREVRKVAVIFAWHMLYLLLYFSSFMLDERLPPAGPGILRVVGLYCNVIAVELSLRFVGESVLSRRMMLTPLWNGKQLTFLGDLPDGARVTVYLHQNARYTSLVAGFVGASFSPNRIAELSRSGARVKFTRYMYVFPRPTVELQLGDVVAKSCDEAFRPLDDGRIRPLKQACILLIFGLVFVTL